jgi:hypothetical protein
MKTLIVAADNIPATNALFAWLINHQLAVLLSQNKQPPATSQQYFSLRTNQLQPSATSQTNRLYGRPSLSQCTGILPLHNITTTTSATWRPKS